jgi:hypothetical protein
VICRLAAGIGELCLVPSGPTGVSIISVKRCEGVQGGDGEGEKISVMRPSS